MAKTEKQTKANQANGKLGGRPKGRKNNKTIEREKELEYIQSRVVAAKQELISAQIHLGTGVSYLYKIESGKGKTRKPKLVKSKGEIEKYLAGDCKGDPDNYYFITTDKPESRSIDSLLDRTVGKAQQSVDVTSKGESLTPLLVKIIGKDE